MYFGFMYGILIDDAVIKKNPVNETEVDPKLHTKKE